MARESPSPSLCLFEDGATRAAIDSEPKPSQAFILEAIAANSGA